MAKDLSQFMEDVVFVVEAKDANLRLDYFLVDRVFWRSRTDLQQRIKTGRVLVNGQKNKASRKLNVGDVVLIQVSREDIADQDPAKIELNFIEEHKDWLVINKQPGILVHPSGRNVYDTLMNALHLRFQDSEIEAHVVHRLDRDTSGVLMFAKNLVTKKFLQIQFEERHPQKEYLALIEGCPKEDEGLMDGPLGPDDKAEIRIKICVRPDGRPSSTRYRVEERFEHHSLVRLWPKTGRQHQLRVHLAHLGHPILCDALYGNPCSLRIRGSTEELLGRQALHAANLHIACAPNEEERHFIADLPPDMAAVLCALRAGESLEWGDDHQSQRWRKIGENS